LAGSWQVGIALLTHCLPQNYRAPGAITSPTPAPSQPAVAAIPTVPNSPPHRTARGSRDHSSDARHTPTFATLSPIAATHFAATPFPPTVSPTGFVTPRQAAMSPHGVGVGAAGSPYGLQFDVMQVALQQVQLGLHSTPPPPPQAPTREWTAYWAGQYDEMRRRMGGGRG